MQCSAAASWKFCFRKRTFLSHCSFACTKFCFSLSVGSLIPRFCCWGGNEGAAGNSGNWTFYYYFRNIPLIEQQRAVLYTDVIPKRAEAYLSEIKITVKLKLISFWVESIHHIKGKCYNAYSERYGLARELQLQENQEYTDWLSHEFKWQ